MAEAIITHTATATSAPVLLPPRLGLLSRVRRSGFPAVSGLIFLAIVLAAIFGPWIQPYDPNALDLVARFKPPFWVTGGSWAHPLGTDNLGRDILSRIIAGARVSMVVAAFAIVVAGGIGSTIGMISGYFGGRTDSLIMRIVDIQMSIPALALALVLAALLRPQLSTVIIVISITYWTWYARIVRAEVISLKERDYVSLARIAGCSTPVIFVRHLLPNVLNTLLVLATLQVGQVITFEASLSFLGLGIQLPQVSWGLMLADARGYLTVAWWAITMPGLAIMLACLSANMLGDWLRDNFDPKRNQL